MGAKWKRLKGLLYFLSVFGVLILLDGVWLGLVAKSFYAEQLSGLSREQFLILPAILVWLLIALGIARFAVPKSHSPGDALVNGALLGLVVYGVYDLTSLAILARWPLLMTFVDVVWGVFICSAGSLAGFFLKNKVLKV